MQVDPHVRLNAGVDAIGIAFSGEVLAPQPPREGQPQNQFNPDRVLFSKFDANAAAIAPFYEQLLGFYVVNVDSYDVAVQIARELAEANPGGAYELRPIALYYPNGEAIEDAPTP